MKIFDCITFFEEHLVTKMRFNILNDYVDKFIVCEGIENHRGVEKKINFNVNDYPEFKNKIKHIICEKFPKNLNPWQRQAFQREHILTETNKLAEDNDLILFSDPDEIPCPKKLKNLKSGDLKNKYVIFLQRLFYYKLNLEENNINKNWEGTRGCKKKYLKSIDFMRQKVLMKNLKYNFWRIDKEKNIQILKDAGWHFAYLLSPEQIQKKIKTFAHTEYDLEKFNNLNHINNAINKGVDIYNRDLTFKKVKIDSSFPDYILNNQHLFKNWIAE